MDGAEGKKGPGFRVDYAMVVIGLLLAIGMMASTVKGISGQVGEAPVADGRRLVATVQG